MRHVIIGASAAGLAAAETLRQRAPADEIVLVSDEPQRPYSRPLLTYLLGGEVKPGQMFLRPPDYFERWGFEARLGTRVAGVDPAARRVRLESGATLGFDRLLIAAGAEARRPGIPGENLPGVFTLRHLADAQRLDKALRPGDRVAVVGAGAVGLKAADALRQRGHAATLVEAEARPLPRLLDDTAAGLLHQALGGLGVELVLGVPPAAVLEGQGRARGLALADGREISAEVVLFAVGVAPRTDFLAGTGLDGAEGIPVDRYMQTNHPDIYAAGDCALPHDLLTGEPAAYRIWPAAVAQGQIAGANLAGAGRPYDGTLPMNSISLRGFQVITGGLATGEGNGLEVVADFDRLRGHYRRLVFQEGRLVGLTLVGPKTMDAGIYFQIMAQKLRLQHLPADPRSPEFQPGRLWG